MKVLAIDASTKSTGVALFDDKKLVKYDCFTASSTDLIKRIQNIILQLNNFIKGCLLWQSFFYVFSHELIKYMLLSL